MRRTSAIRTDRKHFALDGVSFTVRRGEVFGLLGRNGAGKSTLIKAMTTLIQPTSGTLRVLGMDPARDGQRIRSRIGVVQQDESFDFATVQGNLDVYGMLWGVPAPSERGDANNSSRASGSTRSANEGRSISPAARNDVFRSLGSSCTRWTSSSSMSRRSGST